MRIMSVIVWVIFSMTMGHGMASAGDVMEKLTIDAFIATAESDLKFLNQGELTLDLEGAPKSTPYLDRVEFRTKTEEFDVYKQKYSLRFYPKGWGETLYTKRASELESESCRAEQHDYYNDAVKQRYDLALDYLETRALIQLTTQLTTVCEDRVHVLRKKSSGSLSFDISDLIEAEEVLTGLRLERVGLENKMTALMHQIRLAANSQAPIAFDSVSLVRVSTIKKRIPELIPETTVNNIGLQDQKNRVDLADNKYKLEQAKTRDYLSFVQVSYDNDEYDDLQKAYSLELAIKLPFVRSDREEMNRRKVTYMKERLKYEEEKREISEQRTSLMRSLDRLIEQYSILEANKNNGDADVSFKAYLNMDGVDPLNLLKIKESLIKSDIQLVKTGFDIRNRFVALLDLTGQLSQKPVKNYMAL
ncbi:hypothetical protein [Desulfoluna limicola]|nr:hypothetical protein [Desulfoluna limicola]